MACNKFSYISFSNRFAAKSLQSCPTLRPHRRQPTRLPRPWDSPGKNTGVGCHFPLQCMKVKSESEVAQSCPTLCHAMNCSTESDMTERLRFHFSLSCIGEGNGNPLQCFCLENPRDGGAWCAALYGVTQSQPRLKRLSSNSSRILKHFQLLLS